MSWLMIPDCEHSVSSVGSEGLITPCVDGAKLRVIVKSTHTPLEFSSKKWRKVISMLPQFGITLKRSKKLNYARSEESIALQEAFPAKIYPLQEKGLESLKGPPGQAYSSRLSGLFSWLDPKSFTWRMSRQSLLAGWMRFSGRWPYAGIMRDGVCCQRLKWEQTIKENVGGVWRTPAAREPGISTEHLVTKEGKKPKHTNQRLYHKKTGKLKQQGLSQQVQLMPTPTVQDGNGHVGQYPATKTHHTGLTLATAVQMYPTPNSADSHRGADARKRKGSGGPNLLAAVQMFPTPRASANENRQTKRTPSQEKGTHGKCLSVEVHYMTPSARDWKGVSGPNAHAIQRGACANLCDQVGGVLNPTWVEWLMGYPIGWTELDV
jgi:hypothetical protein